MSIAEMREHAAGDEKYAEWLSKVDEICVKKLGVGLFDLPDMMMGDAYADGATPEGFFKEEVAQTAQEDGWDGDDDEDSEGEEYGEG